MSINYRLTPAGKHPANIQDVAKAVAWVHDHIAEHGGDPAQINIMGHSAGAHLTALVATDETRLKAEGKPLSILKRAILLDTAAYDIPRYLTEFQEAKGTSPMRRLYTNAFGDTEEQWRDASPQAHVAPGKHIPPMLMFFTGSRMAANTLAPAFAEALTKAGAPSRAVDTITLTHGEIGMKAADKNHPLGQLVLRFLKGEDATKFPAKLDGSMPPTSAPAHKTGPTTTKPAANTKTDAAQTTHFQFTFTKDYFPGTKDRNGQWSGGTETMELRAHDGKLFASLGYWMDLPYAQPRGDEPWTGAEVLVKEAATGPWRVDVSFSPGYLRTEALTVVAFTTDANRNSHNTAWIY